MPEACTVPIVLEESKLWKRGVTELEMQDTTLPSFSPLLAPPSCYMWILAEGQLGTTCRAWQSETRRELLPSVIPLHLAVLETALSEKLGKVTAPLHPMYAWKKSTHSQKSPSFRRVLSRWGWHHACGLCLLSQGSSDTECQCWTVSSPGRAVTRLSGREIVLSSCDVLHVAQVMVGGNTSQTVQSSATASASFLYVAVDKDPPRIHSGCSDVPG